MNSKPLRILIVDDNQDDRADLRSMMLRGSDERYQFTEAELGRTALAAIAEASGSMPDCILLDYYLPDMDAQEVLASLRGQDGAMPCPVVILTGATEYSFGPILLRAGAQDYVSKDLLNPPMLARVVANAMERWAMGREIMHRERELRAIADNTPDVLTRFDRGYRHVFVNAAVERATGHPADYFIGKTNRELGMPEDLCQLWETMTDAVFTTGQAQSLEFTFERDSGQFFYAARLVPEFGADGSVEYVLGVTHDITERRRAEFIVKASADRLEMALAAAKSGVWEWDIGSDTINWSPENFALYGRDPALGWPAYADWRNSLHPDDMAQAEEEVRKTLAAETPDFRNEFRIVHPRLGVRWLLGLGKVDLDRSGKPLRMFGINLDITERKQMEKALLEEDRRKDEFLATLAHELRNPLAAMSAGLELLKLNQGDAGRAEKTRTMMQRQFRHMVRLVDDLLDISRIGSGKIELKRAPLTVQTIVAHALEATDALIQQLGHSIEVRMPEPPVWVNGDLTRLCQVISNLLNNAAKYTPNGGKILLSATLEGPRVAIHVTDNGAGIPAEMLEKIFDLFTQVEGTLGQAHGGLGIGLSLARRLIDMHGGTIHCKSAGRGIGSTFTAMLPIVEGPVVAETAPLEHQARPVSAPEQRVLIVDDNIDAANSLAMVLQLSGFKTLTAHGGHEALQASRTFGPDVVFLDIGLPGMNGYDVARHLRANPETRHAYLIALTGWGSDDDRQRSSEAGFDIHLTKPVELQTLTRLLQHPVRTASRPD